MKKNDIVKLSRLLFPPLCMACRRVLPYDAKGIKAAFCDECRLELEKALGEYCPSCYSLPCYCTCTPLNVRHSHIEALVKLMFYRKSKPMTVVNSFVNEMKRRYRHDAFCAIAALFLPRLNELMSEYGMNSENTVITFCPRSRKAFLRNGFDQAEKIAEALSELTGIVKTDVFARTDNGFFAKSMKNLSQGQRALYARHIYKVKRSVNVENKNVIMFDDIVTTGSTVSNCARLLKKLKCGHIICLCIASAYTNVKK